MKKLLFTLLTATLTLPLLAQESLLDDLLGVQPVEMKVEGSEEIQAEYQKVLDEETAKVDDDLAKLDEDYKKEVGSLIENFNKVLEKTVEQDVTNEKKRMITSMRTMTMTLKKNKKDIMTGFNNVMSKTIRELPKGTEGKKKENVDTLITEYKEKFDVFDSEARNDLDGLVDDDKEKVQKRYTEKHEFIENFCTITERWIDTRKSSIPVTISNASEICQSSDKIETDKNLVSSIAILKCQIHLNAHCSKYYLNRMK